MRPCNQNLGLCVLLCAGACGGSAPVIDRRIGEVHMHQYDTGAHLSVLFIAPGTPIARTSYDSALPSVQPLLYDAEGCTVYSLSSCENGGCKVPDPIDGGPVALDGLPRAVNLSFDEQLGGYDDLTVDGPFLPGGMKASIVAVGNAKVPAFTGHVQLPMPFSPTSTLQSGIGSGLEIGWSPTKDGSIVQVLLSSVPMAGYSMVATCTVDETTGRYRVPDAILALLPPAPRQLQLEITRYRLVDIPVGDGAGVVMHGGYSVLSALSEP